MRRLLALLFVLLAGPAVAAPFWGLYSTDSVYLTVGQNLGLPAVKGYERMSADNTAGAWVSQAAKAAAIHAAGMKVELTISNIACAGKSCWPTNQATYQAQIAAVLDAIHPDWVNIQNEVDGHESDGSSSFYTDDTTPALTAADYIQQLTWAVQVAHSTGPYAGQGRHYVITNDGISDPGVKLGYFSFRFYLPDGITVNTPANTALADAFAATSILSNNAMAGQSLVGRIPSTASPGIVFLNGRLGFLASFALVQQLLPLYQTTGIDCLNLHWYAVAADVADRQAEMIWLKSATGMNVICSNEGGQRDNLGTTTTSLLTAAQALGFTQFIFFSTLTPGGTAPAQPLSDTSSHLLQTGQAYRDFIAASPTIGALAPCGGLLPTGWLCF